jgi:hypothetical protein
MIGMMSRSGHRRHAPTSYERSTSSSRSEASRTARVYDSLSNVVVDRDRAQRKVDVAQATAYTVRDNLTNLTSNRTGEESIPPPIPKEPQLPVRSLMVRIIQILQKYNIVVGGVQGGWSSVE